MCKQTVPSLPAPLDTHKHMWCQDPRVTGPKAISRSPPMENLPVTFTHAMPVVFQFPWRSKRFRPGYYSEHIEIPHPVQVATELEFMTCLFTKRLRAF